MFGSNWYLTASQEKLNNQGPWMFESGAKHCQKFKNYYLSIFTLESKIFYFLSTPLCFFLLLFSLFKLTFSSFFLMHKVTFKFLNLYQLSFSYKRRLTTTWSRFQITMPKTLTVWITINCGKFWKRWEYQTTWPVSWKTCMQDRKQQLEMDIEHSLVPNRKRSTSKLYIVTLLV